MSYWADQMRSAYRDVHIVPEVVAERCVHTLLVGASCQACVDSCPHQAWVLDDEQLGIDADRCDGCGLCATACPEGAVQSRIVPELRQGPDGTTAFLSCEKCDLPEGAATVSCLHSVTLEALFSLYRKGVETIVACDADCNACPRGAAARLDARLADMNRLLQTRKLSEMHYTRVPPTEWREKFNTQTGTSIAGSGNRRQFFRRLTRMVLDKPVTPDTDKGEEKTRFEPAGTILPSDSPGQMVPFLPQIDPDRCDACNACLNLCPHDALWLAEDGAAYQIDPDNCTGCGICVDLCEKHAITVRTWAIPEVIRIPLFSQRCHDCGVPYFTPTAQPVTGDLCQICRRHRHLKSLFQVHD